MPSQMILIVALALSFNLPSEAVSNKPLAFTIVESIDEITNINDTDNAASSTTASTTLDASSSTMTATTLTPLMTTTASVISSSETPQNPPAAQNTSAFSKEACFPPTVANTVYGCNNELNSSFTCSNAEFVLSAGKFIACQSHEDCKPFQQPNNWCNLPWEYKYTNYGCYCDKKIGSCVIEREQRFTFSRQWAYCIARAEYKCGEKTECF